jgi:transcriptional regulator with XRE-family HTH domain
LAPRARRRLGGLNSEEVAELIGVSNVWYSRFESGRAQFSLSALERLAVALRLSRAERCELLRLARPDVVAFDSKDAHDALSGVGSILTEFERFAKTAKDASSMLEIADGVSRAIHGLFGPSSLGYFQLNDMDSETMPFHGICGPSSCDPLLGYAQPASATAHVRNELLSGLYFEEPDLSVSPSEALRNRIEQTGMQSYHAITFGRQEDDWRFGLGCALKEKSIATDLERSIIATIASIAELALCRP